MQSRQLRSVPLWSVLAAVLVVNVPAFVCMGLDPDALQWDLCTRAVLAGRRPLPRLPPRTTCRACSLPLAVIHSLFGWRLRGAAARRTC